MEVFSEICRRHSMGGRSSYRPICSKNRLAGLKCLSANLCPDYQPSVSKIYIQFLERANYYLQSSPPEARGKE